MKHRGFWTDGVGDVHAGRYDARNKGGTHGPMRRIRGRNSSRPHLHGVALHVYKNASLERNLTFRLWAAASATPSRGQAHQRPFISTALPLSRKRVRMVRTNRRGRTGRSFEVQPQRPSASRRVSTQRGPFIGVVVHCKLRRRAEGRAAGTDPPHGGSPARTQLPSRRRRPTRSMWTTR